MRTLPAAIAGSRAPSSLRREIARAGAELLDDPPDLRAVLASATVALAPLLCGSGVPIKVLEARRYPVEAVRLGFLESVDLALDAVSLSLAIGSG